jgi:hypothetical protein
MVKYNINNKYFLIDKLNIDIKTSVYITDISEEYLFLNNMEDTGDETYKSSDYVLELKNGKIENKNVRLQKYK